ncbi:hypothetical protein HWV62_20390 [Athelia sp. TMB]|nr:hypothetical protein HWV62_20390 [Athelia sp. TMB]
MPPDRFKPWTIGGGDSALAHALAGPGSPLFFGDPPCTELVLGIAPSGASYLLLNLDMLRVFIAEFSLRYPREHCSPLEFLSLSPIRFQDEAELLKKLKTYEQKSGKKGKLRDIGDTSQANKGYARLYNMHHGQPLPGVARAAFEHNRMLYALLQGAVDPHKFGLPYFPWAAPTATAPPNTRIRIVSLALNEWAHDGGVGRKLADRLRDPQILDIGWGELDNPASTVDIRFKEHKMLGQGYARGEFQHGETQILPKHEIAAKLRELFDSFAAGGTPVVLLVHGKDMVQAVLKSASVDLGACVVGIRDLLVRGELVTTPRPNQHLKGEDEDSKYFRERSITLDYEEEDVKHRRALGRSRSRSPARRAPDADTKPPPRIRTPPRTTRTLSPSPRTPAHPVHDRNVFIVDLKELYERLTQTDGHSSRRVADTARSLRLPPSPITGWCAGNDCRTMFDIWAAMAAGPPIDEQRAALLSPPDASHVVAPHAILLPDEPAKPIINGGDDGDDEQDPNDIMPAPAAPLNIAGGAGGNPYDNLEDDEEDDY